VTDLLTLDPTTIIIREDRQRRSFTTEDLEGSFKKYGQLQPIVINDENELIAGERRLTTCIALGMTVKAIRFSDLTPLQQEEVELEENVKRKDLSWQDHARATLRLHNLYAAQSSDPDNWSKEATALKLDYSPRHTARLIDLGEAIVAGDKSIIEADGVGSAYTIYSRRKQRSSAEAVQQLMDAAVRPKAKPTATLAVEVTSADAPGAQATIDVAVPEPTLVPYRIIQSDAIDFFESYDGERFNFLHCDLPYGVELHGQANQDSFEGGGYESNPEIYWELCAAICKGWDNVMFPSSHVMFWFAFQFYEETLAFFQKNAPQIQWQIRTPLIWHKTDNRGILADPKRGPRNVGEYALIGTTEDRFIVKPVGNIYGAPTNKADSIHTNEKPLPMLGHFFSMFVDGHTRLLDPTAGSGSAIRAAEIAGAELALGLEFNSEFARRAQAKLEQERGLRALSKKAAQ
jgi:ParB/RepB/Spo0J family partition protein